MTSHSHGKRVRMSLWLEREEIDAIRRTAERRGISMNAVVRLCVQMGAGLIDEHDVDTVVTFVTGNVSTR